MQSVEYLDSLRGTRKMEITDIRVRKILREGKVKAIISVTIDNAIVIHDIKLVEGQKGLFMALPGRKIADGQFRNIAHPISQEVRDMLQGLLLEKYYAALEQGEFQSVAAVSYTHLDVYKRQVLSLYLLYFVGITSYVGPAETMALGDDHLYVAAGQLLGEWGRCV